jgi:uncharacterized protein YukE
VCWNFREGVRDTFGASIVADVLDPILKEVDSLRIFNAAFQQQSLSIDRTLNDARRTVQRQWVESMNGSAKDFQDVIAKLHKAIANYHEGLVRIDREFNTPKKR